MGESIQGSDKTIGRFEKRCREYAEATGNPNPIGVTNNRFAVYSCALAGMDGTLMRSDSTPVSGNFSVHKREELVFLAVKGGVECLACSASPEQAEALKASVELSKYSDPSFTLNRVSDRWPASKEKKRAMLCKDADALLEIYRMGKDPCGSESIWETVINQQTQVAGGTRVFAEKGDDQLNSGIIQSLLDAEATYRFKNGKHLWGYVLNAIEAANGKAHFVIASCLCPNNKTDSDMANELNRSVPFSSKRSTPCMRNTLP